MWPQHSLRMHMGRARTLGVLERRRCSGAEASLALTLSLTAPRRSSALTPLAGTVVAAMACATALVASRAAATLVAACALALDAFSLQREGGGVGWTASKLGPAAAALQGGAGGGTAAAAAPSEE